MHNFWILILVFSFSFLFGLNCSLFFCLLLWCVSAGLLNSISEDKLDVVDVIVFDTEASSRVRQEALLFLMDHTEGFEEEPGDDQLDLSVATLGGGKSGANKGKGKAAGQVEVDQAQALARRQRAAQQLETLTEYAQHHLGESLDRAYMLAEACVDAKKYGKPCYLHYIYLFSFINSILNDV